MSYIQAALAIVLLALPAVAYAAPAATASGQDPQRDDPVAADRSGDGMVVVPPITDPEAIAVPPRHVDPEIDDVTRQLDKRARERAHARQRKDDTRHQERCEGASPESSR
jgi:hypothetical protein